MIQECRENKCYAAHLDKQSDQHDHQKWVNVNHIRKCHCQQSISRKLRRNRVESVHKFSIVVIVGVGLFGRSKSNHSKLILTNYQHLRLSDFQTLVKVFNCWLYYLATNA